MTSLRSLGTLQKLEDLKLGLTLEELSKRPGDVYHASYNVYGIDGYLHCRLHSGIKTKSVDELIEAVNAICEAKIRTIVQVQLRDDNHSCSWNDEEQVHHYTIKVYVWYK